MAGVVHLELQRAVQGRVALLLLLYLWSLWRGCFLEQGRGKGDSGCSEKPHLLASEATYTKVLPR